VFSALQELKEAGLISRFDYNPIEGSIRWKRRPQRRRSSDD
jgi:hypothetical protein